MKFKNLSMCKYTLASSLILISGLLSLPDAFAQLSQADKTIQEVVVISSRKPIAKSDVVGSVSSISEDRRKRFKKISLLKSSLITIYCCI